MNEPWGIFDLGRQTFVSKTMSFSDEYMGVVLHHGSRTEVERWCDSPTQYGGRTVEVRRLTDQANVSGCLCPVHRATTEENLRQKP